MRIESRACCPAINLRWEARPFSEVGRRVDESCSIDISLKPFFMRVATWVFCEEIVKSAQLCAGFFDWNKITLAAGMVVTNIFLGSMVPIIQHAFREFVNSAHSNPSDVSTYIYPLSYLLGVIVCVVFTHAFNAIMCMKLRNDLAYDMRATLEAGWKQTDAASKYASTLSGSKIKGPKVDMVFMCTKLCEYLVNLINARISTLSLFAGALHSMYLNSGFVLILICFSYVYGFRFLSSWANEIFKKNTIDKNEAMNSLILEDREYEEGNKRIHNIDERSLLPQFGLSLLNKTNSELGTVIGAFALLILTGNTDVITIFNMSLNFSYAAVQASWHRMQLDIIKKLEGAHERVLSILKVLKELGDSEFDVFVEQT